MRNAMLLALTLLLAAPAAYAQPAAIYPADPVRYIPADADLAVLCRFSRLRQTDLWQSFADPKVGLWQGFVKDLGRELNLNLDPEKDLVTAVLSLKVVYAESGEPDTVRAVAALELSHDARPEDLFTRRAEPAPMPGVSVSVYRLDPDVTAAMPGPRLLVIGSPESVKAALERAVAPPLPGSPDFLQSVAGMPGEVAFAGRMPQGLRDAIGTAFQQWKERRFRGGLDLERVLEFALLYNLARLGREVEAARGSVDLSRQADALDLSLALKSDGMAGPIAATLDALSAPLAMALLSMIGAQPRDEPPDQPLYHAAADGRAVRITMPRQAIADLVKDLVAGARQEAGRTESMNNLRMVSVAIQTYVANKGAYPASWSDLLQARLISDMKVLQNPGLEVHFPDYDYQLVPLNAKALDRPFLVVLAYERWQGDAPPSGRLNVLFGDNHVETMDFERFVLLLQQTYKALGR